MLVVNIILKRNTPRCQRIGCNKSSYNTIQLYLASELSKVDGSRDALVTNLILGHKVNKSYSGLKIRELAM